MYVPMYHIEISTISFKVEGIVVELTGKAQFTAFVRLGLKTNTETRLHYANKEKDHLQRCSCYSQTCTHNNAEETSLDDEMVTWSTWVCVLFNENRT